MIVWEDGKDLENKTIKNWIEEEKKFFKQANRNLNETNKNVREK